VKMNNTPSDGELFAVLGCVPAWWLTIGSLLIPHGM